MKLVNVKVIILAIFILGLFLFFNGSIVEGAQGAPPPKKRITPINAAMYEIETAANHGVTCTFSNKQGNCFQKVKRGACTKYDTLGKCIEIAQGGMTTVSNTIDCFNSKTKTYIPTIIKGILQNGTSVIKC